MIKEAVFLLLLEHSTFTAKTGIVYQSHHSSISSGPEIASSSATNPKVGQWERSDHTN
jgi:hypothetical protein